MDLFSRRRVAQPPQHPRAKFRAMARTRISRRRQRAAGVEDRISALPDDLLLLHILGRLDTRSALGAAALSRRWAPLPREPSAVDLKVTDALPPRYRRCLDLLHEARHSTGLRETSVRLLAIAGRYERRAMRAMVSSVRGLLSSRAHRRARRLSLEIFDFSTSATINRVVADAVDSWRVEDLEVVARSTGPLAHPRPVYRFPAGRISRLPPGPGESPRLRSLKLVNCLPPPLEGFTALTTLLLRGLPCSTPAAVYQGVVAACPQLRVLHLVSCEFNRYKVPWLVLDAPMSQIRELVVDGDLMAVKLRSLPKLESLTVVDAILLLCSDAVPTLAHLSLVFASCPLDYSILNHLISRFMRILKDAISITNLVLRFTGPEMWIQRSNNPFSRMPNLKKLLVADVPSSWDVSWPHLLIQAAPLLETLHVHVSQCCQDEEEEETAGQHTSSYAQPLASQQRHRHLKELVVVGFQRTGMQLIHLVRFAVDTSTALCRVALLKHGHVEEKGPWDWEMISQQSTSWSNEEKLAVLDGIQCSTDQIEVVLA